MEGGEITMTLQEKITEYTKQFTTTKRGDETIVIFNNESNELHNSVMGAHETRLPNDWIFEKYLEILERLGEYDIESIDNIEDNRHEIVDGIVDIYTSDLTAWLNDSNMNVEYLSEALEEYGKPESGFQVLTQAQYKAIDDIFNYVLELLQDN